MIVLIFSLHLLQRDGIALETSQLASLNREIQPWREGVVVPLRSVRRRDTRLSDYDLVNSVGRILDTTAAVARLLLSGHLDRYPGVNLLVSHGGAALPFILGPIERSRTHGG